MYIRNVCVYVYMYTSLIYMHYLSVAMNKSVRLQPGPDRDLDIPWFFDQIMVNY